MAPNFIGFEALTKLTYLQMIGSDGHSELPFLAKLTNLKSFSFTPDCDFSNHVTALTGLHYVSLHSCNDSDDLVRLANSVSNLTCFAVSFVTTRVDNLILTRLTTLQRSLIWPELTSSEAASIRQVLPFLELSFD